MLYQRELGLAEIHQLNPFCSKGIWDYFFETKRMLVELGCQNVTIVSRVEKNPK